MTENEETIHRFYTCFGLRDYKGMQSCYSDRAVFHDPAFSNLNVYQVRAMWEMLIKGGKGDLKIEFGGVAENSAGNVTAYWKASYTFSGTGRKVRNEINASFKMKDGLIERHDDDFDFYKWSKQALGLPGVLFGWSPFFQNKIREKAKGRLLYFMNRKTSSTV